MKVCVVGASGKLGQYAVQHALDRGYEVVGVCRGQSVEKLDRFKGRIAVIPGATDDREVIKRAVAGATGCSRCWSHAVSMGTRREPPRRCSTTHILARAWSSRAGGTSPAMVRTSIRGSS